jgi:hypothetical protein
MGAWVRHRRGGARYAGRITRAPFVEWLATPEGQAVLDAAAARLRLRVLARRRAARLRLRFLARRRAARRLWREIALAARSDDVVAVVQSEIDAYPSRLQEFAYAEGLPRASVDLHRIVVVPRVLINAAAYGAITRRLRSVRAFAALAGGEALRDFFVLTLVRDMDAAIARATPSPKRPLAAGTEWVSVGIDGAFAWRVPLLNEPPWDGHHYVLELTRDPITRALRKAVAAAVQRLEASLPALTRVDRNEILRRAAGAGSAS